jgi:CRP/FNR family nitrogen fixation transcriptional regulator
MLNRNPPELSIAGKHYDPGLRYKEGQTIYHEADPAFCWFEVRRGVVRACRFFPDGDRHVTGFYFPGDVFGFDKNLREESAEAVTDVELSRYDHTDTDGFAADGKPVIQKVLRSMKSCVNLLGHRTAEQRVAAFLLLLASRLGTGRTVPVPMSRADIADHLRLTMHTVSRTISRLCSSKVISMSGPQSLDIVDDIALRKAAGELYRHDPQSLLANSRR